MSKEEKEFFYSIGRGSLNLNGKFYYGLGYPITDFMKSLEQENLKLNKYKSIVDNFIKEQRKYIKRLLDELDSADNYLKRVYLENKQLKDNWNKLKEYCQDNSFMQNTREYGTLTVVDADELAIYMEELESGDSNE